METLGNIILTAPGGGAEQHATYVGVYGKWGDGKTTVRHLVEERLRGENQNAEVIFVDFSPWKYPLGTDLWLELCWKLADAIGKLPEKRGAKRTFRQLVRFANLKSTLRKCGDVNGGFDLFRKLWFSTCLTEEELCRNVARELAEIGKTTRIVVAVDDLDRVTPEEVVEVVRFLKANGDLPT